MAGLLEPSGWNTAGTLRLRLSPTTGDNSPVLLLVALLVISLGGLITLLVVKKKKANT